MEAGIRVLYVDDEPELLDIARLFLEQSGEFAVTTATSAEEALASSSIPRYDIIISDYQMEDMDGIGFLKEVRTRYGGIPFILFTGRGREEIVIEAINNGADYYLQKGGDPAAQFAELSHKIRQAVHHRNVERDFQKSRDYLDQIFSSVKAGIVIIDAATHEIVDINPAGADMIGLPREKIAGSICHRFICPAEAGKCPMTDLHSDVDNEERVLVDAGGRNIPIIKNVTWIDLDGRKCLLETFIDNRERRQAQDALQESEEKYRELVENANSIILKMDRAGTITFFNEYAQRFFGYSRDEIIGKSVVGTIVPATESGSGRNLQVLLDNIVTDPDHHLFNENENITRDGRRVWIQWQNKPLLDRNGRPAGVLSIGIDMTWRRQAEEALRESEAKYRQIIENMQDAYIRSDQEGNITMVSPSAARIFGYGSPGEMVGLPVISLYNNPSEREEVMRLLQDGGAAIDYMCEGLRRDGTTFWISLNLQFIRDSGGEIRGSEGTVRDITERRQMERAIHEANRKLNMLSSITRHDIKNQLSALDGFVELLHYRVPDPSLDNYFSRIGSASSQIANLIQFTREYEMIGVHAPSWQDVRVLVDSAGCEILRGQVTLENDLPAGTEIFADPLVARVIYNLVDNAVRHGGKISRLRFSMENRNGDRIITCTDDGDGVPAKDKEKIFDLGFGRHTGFGLAISREILAITGISIRENGEPGEGARFEIVVPNSQIRSLS